MTQKEISEFNFIDKYLKPLALDSKASFNLSDDVALLPCADKGSVMVTSKDLFVENVHFLIDDNPRDIASRLLLSNISDIAASGALPKYYMLGLPKRADLMTGFYDEFCDELSKIQKEYGISLIGGDTVTAKNDLFFSVTIFGEAKDGKILRRNMANIGDDIYVTGLIGGSYLGLQHKLDSKRFSILKDEDLRYIQKCHNKPDVPSLFTHELLLNNLSNCAIDISDGFFADLNHICEESKVSARIFLDKIPICDIGNRLINSGFCDSESLLSGGEDYQIIFTANKLSKNAIFDLANEFKISLNYVGDITSKKSQNIEIENANGENIKLNYLGYEH